MYMLKPECICLTNTHTQVATYSVSYIHLGFHVLYEVHAG